MSKNEVFELLKNLKTASVSRDELLSSLDQICDELQRSFTEVTDDEAWEFITLLNVLPEEVTDGYQSIFLSLIEETAPSWPFGERLLLLEPAKGGALLGIKTDSLHDGGVILSPTKGLPYTPVGLNIKDYWESIVWELLLLEEFRFILLVLSALDGEDLLNGLNSTPPIFKAIEKYGPAVEGTFIEEKRGLAILAKICTRGPIRSEPGLGVS